MSKPFSARIVASSLTANRSRRWPTWIVRDRSSARHWPRSATGLDLVERLGTDLAVLRRRHRGAEVPDELRLAIEERKQSATAVRQAEESANEVVATARVESERADKRLHAVTEHYRAAGGDLLDQRDAAADPGGDAAGSGDRGRYRPEPSWLTSRRCCKSGSY